MAAPGSQSPVSDALMLPDSGRMAGEPWRLLPRERSASEDCLLIGVMPYGERERGCAVEPIGMGETLEWGSDDCGRDMERSEVGVLSSTAEEAFGICCWRAVIWTCCWRIMFRRRFCKERVSL
jgi:hypothetical protein